MGLSVDLYDCAPVGYVVLDDLAHVLSANLMTCRLLGLGRRDVVDRPLFDLVAPHDRRRSIEFWQRVSWGGDDRSCEVDLVHACGDFVTVVCQARRSYELSAWLVAFLDVTDLHHARREAADRHELAERTETAHHLHDSLRQRLFGMGVLIEGLAAAPELTPESRSTLERLHVEVVHMVSDIRQRIFGETTAVSTGCGAGSVS